MIEMLALGDAWLHDLDPVLIPFSRTFGIRWYAVSYILGFLLGGLLLYWLSARGASRIPKHHVFDAALTIIVGVMLGGRLGYVFFYDPSLLVDFTSDPPFWGLLAIHRGGMASHGGMIGVIVACWWLSRGIKQQDGTVAGRVPMLHVTDLLSMVAPVGLFLGRVANFVNGELVAKVVASPGEPAPWWAVRFPKEYLERTEVELLQSRDFETYARAIDLSFARALPAELEAEEWQFGFDRLLYDLQHGSAEAAAVLEPLVAARHPSQLYQAFAEGIIVFAVTWIIAAKPRVPGIVGCWFLITYGAGRIITELYRLPDADIGRLGPLSRGQWLSALMVVAGIVAMGIILTRARSRQPEKLLGWASKRSAPVPQQ